jgi:GH24 family phage-related lysozyme (muramidase)
MARQRVQVAPLEAPTTVRPVASPVDTYIRPAQEPKAKSGLSEFISAITPALKAEAQKEIDARQKQNEKIEAGIASREAFQSKLARAELISQATSGFENNKEYYLEAGRDKIATDRKKYITDYVTDLEASGVHPNIIAEIKNDFDLSTAKFFLDPKNGYNVQKAAYDLNKRDEKVFQQVFKIDDDPNNTDRTAKTAEIADIIESYIQLRGNTKEFFDKFIPLEVTRSKSRGQTSIYDYLNSDLSKNRLYVADYIDDAEAIKENQASLNKARKTVNKPLIKEAAVSQLVSNSISTGNPAGAKVGEKVTVSDGAGGSFEFTVTKEMSAKAADEQFFLADQALRDEVEALSIANSQGRSDPATFETVMETLKQQRVDLEARFFNTHYNPHGIVPARYKLPITAGLPFLQGGDVSEGSQGLAALGSGLKAIRDFKSMGGSMSTLGLSKEQEFKVNALNALLESGREIRDIAPFAAKPIPQDFGRIETLVTEERVKDTIDTSYFFDNTNIDEAQIGYPSLLMDIQKQAKAIMFISEVPMSAEEAVALAIPQVRDNYLTLKTSQWDAFALGDARHFSVVKKVGGQLNSEANEEILDDILKRTFDNERVKEIIEPRLTAIGSKTTGFFDPDMAFAWQQDSRNVNMLNLMAYAEGDYSNIIRVGTINLQKLTSTSSVAFANELAEELNKSVEQADTVELMSLEAQRLAEDSGITIAPAPTGYISDPVSRAYEALNQPMDMSSFGLPSIVTPAAASTLDKSLILPKGVPDEMSKKFVKRVVDLENFRSKPYRLKKADGTYEKHWTVGYGHNGPDVDPNKTYTEAESRALLIKDLNDKFKIIERKLPKFSSYSPALQIEILQSVYRGGLSGSKRTLELINEGRFKEAAKEFLDNKEYIAAEGSTETSGIRPRMESLRDALVKETLFKIPSMTKQKTKSIKDSGVPEDLDSFAFGQTFP